MKHKIRELGKPVQLFFFQFCYHLCRYAFCCAFGQLRYNTCFVQHFDLNQGSFQAAYIFTIYNASMPTVNSVAITMLATPLRASNSILYDGQRRFFC